MAAKLDWDRVERLFEEAASRPPGEREAFLDSVCGSDAALRTEIASLLAADEQAGEFLPAPTLDRSLADTDDSADPTTGRVLGSYKLLAKIGEGGTSSVYLAVRADDQYRKRVAVKLLPLAMASPHHLRRFQTERQILASLDHPSIARLLDGGTTEEGLPYFVMEYIEGEPIDVFCDRHRLGVRERLELFRQVCATVHFAHQNLVVHRDLKPSNILVTEDGIPKLLDFGIAKLLNPELTSAGQEPTLIWHRILTPDYASPEQVGGKAITTASDVYSLGALLYKLLTGRLPRRLADLSPRQIERVLSAEEPEPPSSVVMKSMSDDEATTPESLSQARGLEPAELSRQLAGDLDQIVLMALRQEPQRRYSSPAELSQDLWRYLSKLPVVARKATVQYRAVRFLRRNRIAVAVGLAFLILLLGSAIGLAVLSVRLAQQRDHAEQERDRAQLYAEILEDVFEVSDPDEGQGIHLTAGEILARGARRIRSLPEAQAEVRADLMSTLGTIYRRLGQFEEARPLLESALELRQRILGERHEDAVGSLASLGSLRAEMGDYEVAEDLLRRALAIRLDVLGDDHHDVAESLSDLAFALRESGQYEEAEERYRRSLELRRRLLGEDHADVARNQVWLAATLSLRGDFAESEALFREALARFRRTLGADHLATAEALNDLASMLIDQGEYIEPEELLQEALSIQRKRLGETHPLVVASHSNLGALATFQRDYEKAEVRYQEALERGRESLGKDHPNITYLLLGLGATRLELGHPDEAEPVLRRATEIRRKVFGGEHFLTAKARTLLGACLVRLKRYGEAESLLEAAYGVISKQDPPRQRETLRVVNHLIRLFEARGQTAKADEYRRLRPRLSPPDAEE